MALLDGHDKPIISQTPPEALLNSTPIGLKKADFDRAVHAHGYECYHEKALKCPCSVKSTGQPLSNCQNCLGTGWFFIEKRKTRMLVQAINKTTTYTNWTETDKGTASITARAEIDRFSFMDRITVLDIEVSFQQIVRTRESNSGDIFAFLYYNPLHVEQVYIFNGNNVPLARLVLNVDYFIQGNILLFAPAVAAYYTNNTTGYTDDGKYLTVSVRYRHMPCYNIIDISREAVRNRESVCKDGSTSLKDFPIHAIAKKTHYILDEPNFMGESVYDNTFYGIPPSYLNKSPLSLQFWIDRSTADEIALALLAMNDPIKLQDIKNQI